MTLKEHNVKVKQNIVIEKLLSIVFLCQIM